MQKIPVINTAQIGVRETVDLSILIPVLNEAGNIGHLVKALDAAARDLDLSYEILIVDGGSTDDTRQLALAASPRARIIDQVELGYGGALVEAFRQSSGRYILTMDGDFSHDPMFLPNFWKARHMGEVVIGSRYVAGGKASTSIVRKTLSRILNVFFSKGLSLAYKDLSSGFRLYRADALKKLQFRSSDFDVLEEIIIKSYASGSKVCEIPIYYKPRRSGSSHAKLIKFGIAYLRTFYRMWRLRNSIECADYDDRAFDSIIPLQRYWQRKRSRIIERFAPQNCVTLDIGCGSSRILTSKSLPIGLDIRLNKLRYARKFGRPLVTGSIWNLPFPDAIFDCVICSEVIEHIEGGPRPFTEMRRVLKPNGQLILGTPDYNHRTWLIIEAIYARVAPGGYADEHITHYSLESLTQILQKLGFTILGHDYILNSELILNCRLAKQESASETT